MTRLASVYAEALYTLAKEERLDKAILEELKPLDAAFRTEPDFLRLLSAPNLTKEERCAVLDKCFRGKVQPYTLNFMKLLTEKGSMGHFWACCAAYRDLYNRDHGILPVSAVTAVPLSADQTVGLTAKLARLTGKTIELTNKVEPACLGGMRLDYDGKRVDDTVAHRLEDVRNLLKNSWKVGRVWN